MADVASFLGDRCGRFSLRGTKNRIFIVYNYGTGFSQAANESDFFLSLSFSSSPGLIAGNVTR